MEKNKKLKQYQDTYAKKRGFKDYHEFHNHYTREVVRKNLYPSYLKQIATRKYGVTWDKVTPKMLEDIKQYILDKRNKAQENKNKIEETKKNYEKRVQLGKDGFKQCKHCGETKPFTQFRRLKCLEKRGQLHPYSWLCIKCECALSRKKVSANLDYYIKNLIYSATGKDKSLITQEEIEQKKIELNEKRIKRQQKERGENVQ